MYKSFIIGNPSSVWMKEYIREIHIKNHHEVHITEFEKMNDEYMAEYNAMGVSIVPLSSRKGLIGKLEKTKTLIAFALMHCSKNNQFDIIEVQSPPHSWQVKILERVVAIMKSKVAVFFWGSDILAIDAKAAHRMKGMLDRCDIINIATEQIKKAFVSFYGHQYDSKFICVQFGTLALPKIDDAISRYGKLACKKQWGLNREKLTVAVGYNGRQEQQHIKAIRALSKIKEKQKQKIELLIHMGYGTSMTEAYCQEVRTAAEASGISYIIIKQMLSLEDIGRLRATVDVFLQAQQTDALSGTIRECIYAGAILINPSWIQYSEYDQLGIEYIRYDTFDQLPYIIEWILEGEIYIDTEKNSKMIHDVYSWDSVEDGWMRIFNERVD